MTDSARRGNVEAGTARWLCRAAGRTAAATARRERELWVLLVAAAVADVALTLRGLSLGFSEGNPVVNAVIAQFGFAALFALKAAAVLVAYVGWRRVPDRYAPAIPLLVGGVWTAAALVNFLLVY